MIAKQHRFHGYSSLGFVYRHGSTVREHQVALRFVRNQRQPAYRAAVIVSRKVHKAAVNRNRVRRRIYEIIRAHEAVITEPYDLVFTVFSEQVADMPAERLGATIHTLLQKAGVLHTTGIPRDISGAHAIVKDKRE